jgi:hypothetical protein
MTISWLTHYPRIVTRQRVEQTLDCMNPLPGSTRFGHSIGDGVSSIGQLTAPFVQHGPHSAGPSADRACEPAAA